MCKVIFDDDADTPFADLFSDDAPYTGSLAADDSLAPLIAGSVDGRWRLKVTDGAAVDTGSLRAASLHFGGFGGG